MVIDSSTGFVQTAPVKGCASSSSDGSTTATTQQQLAAMMPRAVPSQLIGLSSASSSSLDDDDSVSLDSRSPCSFSAPSPERDDDYDDDEDDDPMNTMKAKLAPVEEEEKKEKEKEEEEQNLQEFVPDIVKSGVSVATLSDTQLDLSFSFETLRVFFHLPISEAAQNLGVCTTILKKICRLKNIPRWPFRQMRSLDKMIANLEALNLIGQESALRTLADLKKRKENLMKDPNAIAEPLYHHRRKYRTITKRSKRQSEPKPPKTQKTPVKNVFHNVVAPTRYPGAPRTSSPPSSSSSTRSPSPPSAAFPSQVPASQQPVDSQPFVDPKKLFHPYYHFSIRRPAPESKAPSPPPAPSQPAHQLYDNNNNEDINYNLPHHQPHSFPPHSSQLPPRPYWDQHQHQHPPPPSLSYNQQDVPRDSYFPQQAPVPLHLHQQRGPYQHHFEAPPPLNRFSNPDPNHLPPYPHHFDRHSSPLPNHPHHFLNHNSVSPPRAIPPPPHNFHRPLQAPLPPSSFPRPYQQEPQPQPHQYEEDRFYPQARTSHQSFNSLLPPPPFQHQQYQRPDLHAPEPLRIKQEEVQRDEERERGHLFTSMPRTLQVPPALSLPFPEDLLNKQRPDSFRPESLRSPFRDPSTGQFTLPSIRDSPDFPRPPTKIFALEPPVYRS
eukprot:TRINITY_DN4406_c1_g1_i1.p1 TRINITY_DN4406_c1_g1~~TRINITY_DN4406_c1_g1_i1.p1  ORF type:complete len:662 (+),score=286.98 TRINITY_DN4406_c1_g1_i1:349-2334(+)